MGAEAGAWRAPPCDLRGGEVVAQRPVATCLQQSCDTRTNTHLVHGPSATLPTLRRGGSLRARYARLQHSTARGPGPGWNRIDMG